MEPTSQAGNEGVVPGNPKGGKTGPDSEFIKRFTCLKWEYLRTGVSLAVRQCPFPKPLLYKQLKEDLSMHQIVTTLSRQKTRHLNFFGKQEPLCAMPLEENEFITSTRQFAFEKAIEAEQRWSKLSLDVCHACDGCHLTKTRKMAVEF
jgi:hypothetical protein